MFARARATKRKTKCEGKALNYKFDELTKGIAQSVTRRDALKKFGVGFAGLLLAAFGIGGTHRAAAQGGYTCCIYSCFVESGQHRGQVKYYACVALGADCPAVGGCYLQNVSTVKDCIHCGKL